MTIPDDIMERARKARQVLAGFEAQLAAMPELDRALEEVIESYGAAIGAAHDAALTAERTRLQAEIDGLRRERDELVERAFRDGIAYATNVEVTDVDEAWRTSAVRESIRALGKDGA